MKDYRKKINHINSGDYRLTGRVSVCSCRESEEGDVVICSEERAEFWGVYVETCDCDGLLVADWVEDFGTKDGAEQFAADLSAYIKAHFDFAGATK